MAMKSNRMKLQKEVLHIILDVFKTGTCVYRVLRLMICKLNKSYIILRINILKCVYVCFKQHSDV